MGIGEKAGGVRRARASPVVDKKQTMKRSERLVGIYVKTRAAAATVVEVKRRKEEAVNGGGLSANKVTSQEEEGNTAP
ncbi:hypothetical protein L1987_79957 [Smallanthus sonchifolius]|uniref:Uncharacterized protein n=1 Tax=Smallanthus sonchifolius TaxID=185202 RepID=A0ACB8YMF0_9ASTR|nr:hypothetical protein L1987_79957 [Smallanthus sonchifolius]